MASTSSFQQIFDQPLPDLSPWNQINKSPKKPPIETSSSSSFAEIFGELHFNEKKRHASAESLPPSPASSSPPRLYLTPQACSIQKHDLHNYISSNRKQSLYHNHNKSDSFSSMNSESALQYFTEGQGFESSDDPEDLKTEVSDVESSSHEGRRRSRRKKNLLRRSRSTLSGGKILMFPPPIPSIGVSGKPWVCFKSYRQDGRFVLKEIRIPTQEYLHARREDGRLKLQFFQSDDEIQEEEEEEEDDDDDEKDDDHDQS